MNLTCCTAAPLSRMGPAWLTSLAARCKASGVISAARRPGLSTAVACSMIQPIKLVSKAVEGAKPSFPRSGASVAVLGGKDILMFGGYIEAEDSKDREPTNETWLFDLESSDWRRLPTNFADEPRARIVSQAVAVGKHVWVIGGWDPSDKATGGILGDLWCLDTETRRWSQVTPTGEPLQPISRFQACAVGNLIYIHTHRSLDDILVLDTATQPPTLSKVAVLPDPQHGAPSARGLHSMTLVGSQLVLFGGAPQRGPMLADLWALDTAQQPLRWQALAPEGPSPHPRCSQASAALGTQLIILGGSYYREDGGGLQPLGDCWALDTQALRWQQLQIEGDQPAPRNAAVLAAVGGRLVYHGGWKPFQVTHNDTYIMELQS